MKKKMLLSLSIFLFTASLVPNAVQGVWAKSETSALEKDALLLPQTYEEYLPLSSPTDVAVCENYTAIADGNRIYIYDKTAGEYQVFQHEKSGIATQDEVKKLQFSEGGKLYYADSSSGDNFYELNVHDFTTKKFEDIACDTFVIHDQALYFAGPTGVLYSTSLVDDDAPKTPLRLSASPRNPVLAFWNGELYFTDDGATQILYKIDPASDAPAQVATFAEPIGNMTIHQDVFACSTNAGNFHVYPLSGIPDQPKTQIQSGDYSALDAYDGYFYVIKENAVRQYSLQDYAFTGFEICSQSDAPNRLRGASKLALSGENLFVADNGNARISVYNRKDNAFLTAIPTEMQTLYLASHGETLVTANAEKVVVYAIGEENYGEKLATFENFHGNIVGVAGVYGKYYLATDKSQFYSLAYDTEWKVSAPTEKSVPAPKALASDAYGNLYTLTSFQVYRYTEEEFLSVSTEGEKLPFASVPAHATELAVDFHKRVYALSENSVYDLTAQTELSFSTPLVYPQTQNANVLSFTFGVEENETYLLCDGAYIVRSPRLHLPTVKTIFVNGADEHVFANAPAEFTVVQTANNALLVEFDLQALPGETYFPYLGLERSATPKTALVIGKTDAYSLLASFDENKNAYRTYLALSADCSPLNADEYRKTYAESERKTGYLTNAIALYKYPYLNGLLTVDALARGTEIVLLGEIEKLDHAYYHISYTDEQGVTRTGYIPQSYANTFSGLPPVSETVEVGETDSNHDSVWRFAYLILGFGAICILVDYLILRKKGGND